MKKTRLDKKRTWEKPKYSKFIVLLVIGLNTWFANRIINAFIITGDEPKTLIAAWFAFTVGEVWLLAGITKQKLKKEDQESEEDSEKEEVEEDYGYLEEE